MEVILHFYNKANNLAILLRNCICIFGIFMFLNACQVYRQNILFTTDEEFQSETAAFLVEEAESSYIIRPYDYLNVDVYTNKGERIIDPNFELVNENFRNQQQGQPEPRFLVRADGIVNLPIVGEVKLAGQTLPQADSILAVAYADYYEAPYVITRYINKRVIVLGAMGGQVIPLENENMSLIEILALAGGLSNEAKGHNIRLIRGDLDDPKVQIIDLSTIQGIREAQLKVQPGDIIYIEPVRRIVSETIRDISPILSVITSLFTILVLARNF